MKQWRWTAHFYRWFLEQPPKKQKEVLKNLEQEREYVWSLAKKTYVLKRS